MTAVMQRLAPDGDRPPTRTSPATPHPDLGARNRRILRVLLAIVAALAMATLLVGIRW